MDKTAQKVKEFHEAFGLDVNTRPKSYSLSFDDRLELGHVINQLYKLECSCKDEASRTKSPVMLRARLIISELRELFSAVDDCNIKEVLHESADLRYVCDGLLVETGLYGVFDEAFDRVHKAQFSKLGVDGKPIYDEAGKVVKGPNFKPATMEGLV